MHVAGWLHIVLISMPRTCMAQSITSSAPPSEAVMPPLCALSYYNLCKRGVRPPPHLCHSHEISLATVASRTCYYAMVTWGCAQVTKLPED